MGLLHRARAAVTGRLPVKTARSRLEAPLASVSFDDFPRSAWTTGGPLLAKHGARASYYASGRFCGAVEDGIEYFHRGELKEIEAASHEVGCHGFGHIRGPQAASDALDLDFERNALFLEQELGGFRASSYAYPYGDVSPRTKVLAARRYAVSRGIYAGVNAGNIDLAELRAVPIEARRWRPDRIDAAVQAAKARRGWVIFFTHDVSPAPTPFGCTPEMLDYVLQSLAGIEVLPIKHAMAKAVFGTA
jgi:peptidoglycan/xylan/chitin deacetylase (PgdA/CDA1 family)